MEKYLLRRLINMDKIDIIKTLSSLNLPTSEYWVGYGAALCMHGVKPTTKDIDCGCSSKLFKRLAKEYPVEKAPLGGDMIRINEYVDFYEERIPGSNLIFIDGFQVQSLGSIREEKLQRGREKDLLDVKIIDYLINHKECI